MSLEEIASKIKIVLTDVDGVLTDGGMYYSENGDIMKKFHVRDGMGVTLLKKIGIPTIIVTKESTKMVEQWAKKMKIEQLLDGVLQKELVVDEICKKYEINPEQIAYIGDDVNDTELLKKVGLSGVPQDATKEAISVSNFQCNTDSGKGAFREFADFIISNQK